MILLNKRKPAGAAEASLEGLVIETYFHSSAHTAGLHSHFTEKGISIILNDFFITDESDSQRGSDQ